MSAILDFLADLDAPPTSLSDDEFAEAAASGEIVVDRATGRPRHAGTLASEGQFVMEFKARAEQSLFVFSKGIFGRDYLSPVLHKQGCEWLQRIPPFRKLLLWPRLHAKTSVVSHCLPVHILIQPAESNCYLPGRDGANTRILLAGEAETRAANNLRVIESAFESKALLRALWPHRCWDRPRQEAKVWNNHAMVIPRSIDYADPSIQAIGVDGSITGARFDVLIKDDLVTLEAANSPTVMEAAYEWHIASRALMDREDSREFIIGTRWAVQDIYQRIMQDDPSVEVQCRAIIEDGQPIWPARFSLAPEPGKTCIENLRKESGVLFPLLYMNSTADPSLTDFVIADVRQFEIRDGKICFREDEQDVVLSERQHAPKPTTSGVTQNFRGMPFNRHTAGTILDRGNGYLRFKYG